MPIVAASNGIRPEIRALAVIKLNKPVTPKEINNCVGTGDYAAKYISFLTNRYGFTFNRKYDGRTVVSYTCVGEPANIAELRAMKPKTKATKQPKVDVQAAKLGKLKAAAPVKNTKVVAKAAAKKVKIDPVEKTLGSTGEIAGSFSVDADFDSMDGVDVKDFLR